MTSKHSGGPERLQPGTTAHAEALSDMRVLSGALRKGVQLSLFPSERTFVCGMLDRRRMFGDRVAIYRGQAAWLGKIVNRNRWLLSLVAANDNDQLELPFNSR